MQTYWYCYLVRCCDHSLYSGVTTDLNGEVAMQNAGLGSKYTRAKGPVRLVHFERLLSKSAAIRREAAIRKLPKNQKEVLVLGRRGAMVSQWEGINVNRQPAARLA